MLDRLEAIKARFDQLGVALTNPEIVGNNKRFAETSKEYRSLEKIVIAYEEYKIVLDDLAMYKDAQNGTDEELRELAKEELPALEEKKEKMETSIRQMLIPKDPQDEKNAIIEIRAGTGGDEASLFAGDLLRMYMRYCERRGWKTAILSESEGTVGGYKEVSWLNKTFKEEKKKKQGEEFPRHRKSLVSTGDRSAKIRTYNFPQGRVTDHRINLTSYNLPAVLNGDINEFIEALQFAENSEKLAKQN